MHHRSHDQGGLHPGILHAGGCKGGLHLGESASGGLYPGGLGRPPLELRGILWDAVNKWAVHILVLFEIKIKRCKIYTEIKIFFAKFQYYIAELFFVQKLKC